MGSLRFAPLRRQGLRRLTLQLPSEGGPQDRFAMHLLAGTPSLFAGLRRHSPTIRPWIFYACFRHAAQLHLTSSRVPSATGEGGVPNSSPLGPRPFLGAGVALTHARVKRRAPSATLRTFACHHTLAARLLR